MEAPAKGGMALYYKKLLELQEKLKERERVHCKKLQFHCRKLIDKDRRRQERNDEIIRSLEDIEMRMRRLTSNTKYLESFRSSKEYNLQKNRHSQIGNEESAEISFAGNYNREGYDEKTPNRAKLPAFNNRDKKLDKPLYHTFNKTSDDLNSLAEYMTNSISSRYYKKDMIETTPNPCYSVSPPKKEFEKGIYDEIKNEKMNRNFSYDTENLKVYEPITHHQNLVSENKDELDNQPSIKDSQKDYQIHRTSVDGERDIDQEPSQIEKEKKNGTKLESSMNISHKAGFNNSDYVEKDLIFENYPKNAGISLIDKHGLLEKNSGSFDSLKQNHNMKDEKNIDKSCQQTEQHFGKQYDDENNKACDKEATGSFNNYKDFQVTQPVYEDKVNESSQYLTDREPKQFSTTTVEKSNAHTTSEMQPDVDKQSGIYSDIQNNEYGQPINHIEQTLHCSATDQQHQNSDFDKNPTENRTILSHLNKTKESDLAIEPFDQEQKENSKHQDTAISKTNKEEFETQIVSPNQETSNEIHSEQVADGIQQSMRTLEFEHEIDNTNPSQGQHLDDQYDPHTQHFEHDSRLQYDENGQLQEYDTNSEYHYNQQYDNTGQHYEENSEMYHQQYGQYDESQMYQQVGEMHTIEGGQHPYMNQDEQYDEHNPQTQNYQYNEGLNSSGDNSGIYMNQDGIYPDNSQASGTEGINASEVHSVPQIQNYQYKEGLNSSGDNTGIYMNQDGIYPDNSQASGNEGINTSEVPQIQNYQYNEGPNSSGDNTGIYMNQDGIYPDNSQASGTEGINASEVHSVPQIQNYQYNEGLNSSGDDTGIYMNQDGIYPDNLQASGTEGINASEVPQIQNYQYNEGLNSSGDNTGIYMNQDGIYPDNFQASGTEGINASEVPQIQNYQYNEGPNSSGDNTGIYMNQDGIYPDNLQASGTEGINASEVPQIQNYQYNEGLNSSGDNTGIYMNQDGIYPDNLQASGTEGINASEVPQIQNYQYNEGPNSSGDNTGIYMNQDGIYPDDLQASGTEGINASEVHSDAYMGQMEQYDQISNISLQTYQQHHEVDDTMKDVDAEQVSKNAVTTASENEVIQN